MRGRYDPIPEDEEEGERTEQKAVGGLKTEEPETGDSANSRISDK